MIYTKEEKSPIEQMIELGRINVPTEAKETTTTNEILLNKGDAVEFSLDGYNHYGHISNNSTSPVTTVLISHIDGKRVNRNMVVQKTKLHLV